MTERWKKQERNEGGERNTLPPLPFLSLSLFLSFSLSLSSHAIEVRDLSYECGVVRVVNVETSRVGSSCSLPSPHVKFLKFPIEVVVQLVLFHSLA